MVSTTATFWVVATGTESLAYQWQKLSSNCADLSGCTDTILCLTKVQSTNAGAYAAVVTNLAGAVTSRLAQLSVAVGWVSTNAQGARLPYRLFLPPNYDPAANYPLVLFWHGCGEIATDNLAQLRDYGQYVFLTASNLAKYPCFRWGGREPAQRRCQRHLYALPVRRTLYLAGRL